LRGSFTYHQPIEAVKMKPAEGSDIGQGIQRKITCGIVMDMVDHPVQALFIACGHALVLSPMVMACLRLTNLAKLLTCGMAIF
jgi:hypothetical protein